MPFAFWPIMNSVKPPLRFASSLTFFFLVWISSFSIRKCSAQTVHDFGGWFSANMTGKSYFLPEDSKLRWWFDGHLRYFDDAGGFGQSIFRPGVGYQLNPNTSLWLGYGWINESPVSGNPTFSENRIFQQLLWSDKLGEFSVQSRTRLEQRYVETGSDTGWRFRQFCRAHREIQPESPWILVAWDEIFVDLNTTDWGQNGSFSQNRLFLGIGRKLNGPNSPRLEIGYLNQFIRRKSAGDTINHILSTNWFWNF